MKRAHPSSDRYAPGRHKLNVTRVTLSPLQQLQRQWETLMAGEWKPQSPRQPMTGCLVIRRDELNNRYALTARARRFVQIALARRGVQSVDVVWNDHVCPCAGDAIAVLEEAMALAKADRHGDDLFKNGRYVPAVSHSGEA